jgi:virginiamycin B lyase
MTASDAIRPASREGWMARGGIAMLASISVSSCREPAASTSAGKSLVESRCVSCHDFRRVTRGGGDLAGWRNTVAMMVNVGARLTPAEADEVSRYLAAAYPEKPKPQAVVITGPVRVSFQEWLVPTPGSRPHDPLATPDGMVWYSGQMANVLGRLDPHSGVIKEFRLPAGSGPHGLVADPKGNIWFTANFAGYIGRLDPTTGQVTRYPMPDPAARDPHTLAFDRQGVIWFTVQNGDMVGRLAPASGHIRLLRVPTPKANPYGLAIDSKGTPFFDEFGAPKIGRIDPKALAIREYLLPHADSRPRRIAVTADDAVWYTDYGRGYLGRLDPETGATREWASPGGPESRPYAIAVLDSAIWYVESNTRPNALVRFDPATARFQTWTIPAGGGVVRNMVTADGRLALAESGVNRIALVRIGRR